MKGNEMIVEVDEINSKEEASNLIGRKAVYSTSSGKKINGKIRNTHGNSGAVRVRFRKGLPGQAIGEEVKIYED